MPYLFNNGPRLAELFGQHLYLTLVSLAIAGLIGLPLGVLLHRVRPLRGPLLALFSVLYTIPSLSLLVLLIPFSGLSATTAIIALVIYAQLVLVRNTLAGLDGVDSRIVEAATGMGMSSWQRLWRVELPLASPVILAGLRVAAVSTVGIAAIAAFINAGGLGVLLFEGVRTSNYDKIVAGAIAISLLAVALNWGLRLVERRLEARVHGEGAGV
jgi:osmoprotectant transport system permease protein